MLLKKNNNAKGGEDMYKKPIMSDIGSYSKVAGDYCYGGGSSVKPGIE